MTTAIELKTKNTGSIKQPIRFPSITVGSAIPGRLLLSSACFRFTELLKITKMFEKTNKIKNNLLNNNNLINGAIWHYWK
jgi:hypothetical protein